MATRRFTRDEAIKAILESGLDLISEHGPSNGFERVSFADAIERAGVPRPSAYRAFGDSSDDPQEHFRNALVVEVTHQWLKAGTRSMVDNIQHLLERASADDVTDERLSWLLREAVRVGANAHEVAASSDPLVSPYITVLAASGGVNPLVVEELRSAEQDSNKRYVEVMILVAQIFGVRLAEGWTWEAFVTALVSIHIGTFAITNVAVWNDPIPRPTGENGELVDWTLMGILVEGLILTSFEPNPRMVVSAKPATWRNNAELVI